MATKPKKESTRFVNKYSGRSGSSAALVSPSGKKRGIPSTKGGVTYESGKWVTDRNSFEVKDPKTGKKTTHYSPSPESLGREVTTVRSGRNSKKTYVSEGKFVGKPGGVPRKPTNKRGR